MKKLFGILCAVGITATALSFNENEIADFQGTNNPDLAKSYVDWRGEKFDSKTGKEKSHIGKVGIKDAKVKLKNNTPESLLVTVNLNDMSNYDLPESVQGQLISHLKSADFFDVSLFPDATFTTTKITKLDNDKFQFNMVGNIKVKGISKPIEVKGHIVEVSGKKLIESDVFYLSGEQFGFIKPGGDFKDVELRLQLYVD